MITGDGGPLRTGPMPRQGRTRNRNPAIEGLDGRTKASIKFRNLVGALSFDLGHEPNTMELGLIRQAALSIVLAEQLQAKALRDEASTVELGEIARLQNVLIRCLATLGLNRRKRRNALDLDAY